MRRLSVRVNWILLVTFVVCTTATPIPAPSQDFDDAPSILDSLGFFNDMIESDDLVDSNSNRPAGRNAWSARGSGIQIETVAVTHPGNGDDKQTGFGNVDVEYEIGKYEVTNSQYVVFLNSVASTDTHGLYNPQMATNDIGGIIRKGNDGNYAYSSKNNFEDRPVNFVNFWDAARFVNWLNNGQPVGLQDNFTTESGAYFLNGITYPDNKSIARTLSAAWVLPSENEWYKAAYYQPANEGGDSSDYWDFPTGSNSWPIEALVNSEGITTNPGANVANYQASNPDDTISNVGGAGTLSQSFFGTFDQSGNIQEWTETVEGANRITRGGHWANWVFAMISSTREGISPNGENPYWGFRVAKVEPLAQSEKLLFIRAEFSDEPMGISNLTWLNRLVDVNSIAETFYERDSFGRLSEFDSEYTDVVALPEPSTGYQGIENVHKLKEHMRNAATAAGWDWSQYDQVVLSYPGVLNQPFGAAALPGTVWLPGDNPWGPGFTHEMGHAFGVGHASSIEGDNVPYPGEHREGRDGVHMMGSDDGRQAHTNIAMKNQMGFVGPDYLTRVFQSGVFRIHAFDLATLPNLNSKKLAAIVQVNGKQFWVSYAPGMAVVWADFGGAVWQHGVEVHELVGASTRILDFTPGSRGSGNTEDYWDTRDGALVTGQSFEFPGSSVNILPIRTGVGGDARKWIDVQITTTPTDEVLPETAIIVSGSAGTGTVEDLHQSDDTYFSVGRDASRLQSVAIVEVKGIVAVEIPSGIKFVLESRVFARRDITQTVSMFNYETDSFEIVDSRLASQTSDSVINIALAGDFTRFVQPGTLCIEAQILYRGVQNRVQFKAKLDRATWIITN